MSKYYSLVSFDAKNAERTFDQFYEYNSLVHGKMMCFSSTLRLGEDLIAAVSINKHSYHIQFFDIRDYSLTNVVFTNGDEEGEVQLFDNLRLLEDDCLAIFPSIHDVPDEALVKFNLSRECLIILYNLHNDLIKILKKDETIQKDVI